MKALKLAAAVVAATVAGFASGAHAASIVDGSFETSAVSPNGYYTEIGVGSTLIPGWSVVSGTIVYITRPSGYWVAANGVDSLDLAGSGPGAIAQTITTTVGQRYIISFDMAANPDDNSHGYSKKELSVNATGGTTDIYTFNNPTATYSDLGWTKMNYEFIATSVSTVLTFADIDPTVNNPDSLYYGTSGSPYGAALDNVSISVPEPASWALMFMGFFGLGAALRRSRGKKDGVLTTA